MTKLLRQITLAEGVSEANANLMYCGYAVLQHPSEG